MTSSMLMEMNLGENGGSRQSVNGGGGGRRKSKGRELKAKKPCQRGMGVEQLERQRLERERVEMNQEAWKKMNEVPSSLHPFALPAFNSSVGFTPSCTTAAVQLRPVQPPPPIMFHGIGIHGTNIFSSDRVMEPSVIGSSNVGFRFENSKELSLIPNYVKCPSDGCGVCQKKKRIHGGSNAYLNLSGNYTLAERIDAAKTRRRCSGQVTEVMSVHRNGGSAMPEYDFFSGKGGRSDDYKESMRMGTTSWCGSGTSVGGATGLHGGDRSCVTALTGNEERSVSSVDLSLRL